MPVGAILKARRPAASYPFDCVERRTSPQSSGSDAENPILIEWGRYGLMACKVDAQTLGPLLVFGAFAASDAAVRLLEAYPGSALAWYLNFDVFYTFELARLRDSPLTPLFGPYGLLLDAGMIASVILARATRTRVLVAFLANLGFAAFLVLMHCRFCDPTGRGGYARTLLWESREAEMLLGATLLSVSLLAFAQSHLTFVTAVIREWSQRRELRSESGNRLDVSPVGSMC